MDPRQEAILQYLGESGFISAESLAGILKVSAITIRRDLTALEEQGLLKRVHGGAVSRDDRLAAAPISGRLRQAARAKKEIAAYAATLVKRGDTLFLDAGSTCYFLAEALPERNELTVVTHSLDSVIALRGKPGIRVICIGGELDATLDAFLGPVTEAELESFTVDRAFVGTAGIDAVKGCVNNSVSETRIKQIMTKMARDCYILADASKFGQVALYRTIPITAVRHLITDASARAAQLKPFTERGIKVHVAPATSRAG